MHDITGFQRDCLYVIAGLDTPNGVLIRDELNDYYETEVDQGRVYPNLDTLVEVGLIEKNQQDQQMKNQRMRTNAYTLTQRGQCEIAARQDWEAQYIDQ